MGFKEFFCSCLLGLLFGACDDAPAADFPGDLYFEIHSQDLAKVVERKGSLEKLSKFHCQVFWLEGKMKARAAGEGLSKQRAEALEDICSRKAFLVLPSSMKNYLAPFAKEGISAGWTIYKDSTGVLSINEVAVKENKEKLSIIEKRPSGTTRITYRYGVVKGERKIIEAEYSSYEGIQNIQTKNSLEYEQQEGFIFPTKLKAKTTQNLVRKDAGTYSRNFDEEYIFKNFHVNKSKAALFFSQQ